MPYRKKTLRRLPPLTRDLVDSLESDVKKLKRRLAHVHTAETDLWRQQQVQPDASRPISTVELPGVCDCGCHRGLCGACGPHADGVQP